MNECNENKKVIIEIISYLISELISEEKQKERGIELNISEIGDQSQMHWKNKLKPNSIKKESQHIGRYSPRKRHKVISRNYKQYIHSRITF